MKRYFKLGEIVVGSWKQTGSTPPTRGATDCPHLPLGAPSVFLVECHKAFAVKKLEAEGNPDRANVSVYEAKDCNISKVKEMLEVLFFFQFQSFGVQSAAPQ